MRWVTRESAHAIASEREEPCLRLGTWAAEVLLSRGTTPWGWKGDISPGRREGTRHRQPQGSDAVVRYLVLAFLLGMAGCATARVEGVAQRLPAGGQGVTIEVASFTFRPNAITLQARMPVTITAVSDSGIGHNLTILSPAGQVLKSVDIPASQTVGFEVTVPEPGRYVFYCDRVLHRPLGMEGVLVVR